MITIKRNSKTHLTLMYLRMMKRPVSIQEVYDLSPKKFEQRYRISRSMKVLLGLQFAQQVGTCYAITQLGIDALYTIVKEQPAKENV